MLLSLDMAHCIAECNRIFGNTAKYSIDRSRLELDQKWFKIVFSFKKGQLERIYCFDCNFGLPLFLGFDRNDLEKTITYAYELSQEASRQQDCRLSNETATPNGQYIKEFSLEKYFPNQVTKNQT
jgi:hypothetical protein